MKMYLNQNLILGIFFMMTYSSASCQVYAAKGGAFVVFQEKAEKEISCNFSEKDKNITQFGWPHNLNDFIKSYRASELIFIPPFPMTDQDLTNYWTKLNKMKELAFVVQYHPVMLMALGQAAYVANDHSQKDYTIEIIHADKSETNTALKFTDHIASTHMNTKFESGIDKGTNIQMKLTLPKDSWIRNARVYKKAVGGRDSFEIFPFIMTTQMHDRAEMIIRDTTKQVGEFIYSIHPTDLLGNTHPDLQNMYVQNYNSISEPRVSNFKSHVVENSKTIKLSWQSITTERVRGFEIYRGPQMDGPFMKIATLEPEDSVYIDHVNGVMQGFFYYVQIIDQTGQGIKGITSFVIPTLKEKPVSPPDLIAESVKNGIRVSWPTTDDLYLIRGYYVYRRDRDTSSWTQVSNFLAKTGMTMTFTDTSNLLIPNLQYTYGVKAESTSYILSDFSPLASSRPDKSRIVLPPDDPEWRRLDDGHIMLFWNDQRIKDPYIVMYHIFTIDANGKFSIEVKNSPIDAKEQFWMNPDPSENQSGYCIQSEDAWGNKSACSDPVKPLQKNSSVNPGIILVHPTSTGYHLSWGTPAAGVKSILLYEIKENGDVSLLKTFIPQIISFDILVLKNDQVRTFYLTYKMDDGKESERGDLVVLSK